MSIQQALLAMVGAADTGAYQIDQSLRFNSADSAYLNRTPGSAGNLKTMTFSCWAKLSTKSGEGVLFYAAFSTGYCKLGYNSGGNRELYLRQYAGGTDYFHLATSAFYRDPSAWYHIVVAVDTDNGTASNRLKLYVNGQQVTAFSTSTYPSSGQALGWNNNVAHRIGADANPFYFDGYLAEINFIDGSALTPSSFGEPDTITGAWIPKKYSGSYGTNGFYLNFSDNSGTTSTTLGKDSSGNGNNWTPNNFSVTAGVGNDVLSDTPTTNWCTLNSLNKGSNLTISNGNLDVSSSAGHATVLTTIPVTAGMKSYMEFTVTTDATGGWGVTTNPAAENSYGEIAGKWWAYDNGGNFVIINQTSPSNYSPRINGGDVLQLAVDYSTGKVHLGINNIWISSTNGTDGNPATGANPTFTLSTTSPIFPIFESAGLYAAANFGQRAFAYTPPTGYKALNTANLPEPTIKDGGKYFDTFLYNGTNSSSASNKTGDFTWTPDFVWIKNRNGTNSHRLVDVVRGTGKSLISNSTAAEVNSTTYAPTAFISGGYTTETSDNSINGLTSDTYVAWNWKAGGAGSSNTAGSITSTVSANPSAGFSIVSYTGTGANATIGHGLGVAPKMVIVKSRDTNPSDWLVYHSEANTGNPGYMYLNLTLQNQIDNGNGIWNNTRPTSTVFSVGNYVYTNKLNDKFVAYCFSEVAGYSKFGSYTGNGSVSGDGPFVFCGFRPAWVMIKNATLSGGNWRLIDTARETYNVGWMDLYANSSTGETAHTAGTTNQIDILSNGFKLRDQYNETNRNGDTLIFAAFAELPFKYSTAR